MNSQKPVKSNKTRGLLADSLVKLANLDVHGRKEELSRSADISRISLNNYLKKSQAATVDALDALAGALGVSSWELICPPTIRDVAGAAKLLAAFNKREAFAIEEILGALADATVEDNREALIAEIRSVLVDAGRLSPLPDPGNQPSQRRKRERGLLD